MNAPPNASRTILITGGARGIGAASARLLAEKGARVLVTDILDGEGESLAAQIGERAAYHRLDVSSEQGWADAIARCEDLFGRIDGLFNNAGILAHGSVTECSPEEFRRVVEINLTGIFLGIRAAAPALRRAGGGTIVNTSSIAGMQGYARLCAYVASKWAIRGLTKSAALDLAGDGIRVVSLHPGPIRTPMTEDMPEKVAANQPIARFGEAEEVARMVRFLFSEASYSTGCEFVIDGGALAGTCLPLEPESPGSEQSVPDGK
ncbi:3-ketoacyl-(acyl-carrier-protein) reductase FabG [Erythrobacter litoralis]|jgi:3alpha(or 20beta)-hydroxysteroid dehydrogenase|uniref:3-alpha-hydroxysteroid dehydrogenase n=1 Tax=Erythrobacter litoralis TaxID=39960 RepID=A0A074N6B4_9SPHN|nr:SDR family oxidoreductase [Erythrobacter litoralis]AOL24290.1 3-ketoacyl-(acyl-carrier-protein) reductase FabG [Erythrobacter litoralis]KEO93467.1 3-alpha-hydroxysteroid dehydrogenase [Erythrobacter litoralis]MEE4338962.1 SDR family oxidoreductase [Erythrobacter sp.]